METILMHRFQRERKICNCSSPICFICYTRSLNCKSTYKSMSSQYEKELPSRMEKMKNQLPRESENLNCSFPGLNCKSTYKNMSSQYEKELLSRMEKMNNQLPRESENLNCSFAGLNRCSSPAEIRSGRPKGEIVRNEMLEKILFGISNLWTRDLKRVPESVRIWIKLATVPIILTRYLKSIHARPRASTDGFS